MTSATGGNTTSLWKIYSPCPPKMGQTGRLGFSLAIVRRRLKTLEGRQAIWRL